MHFRGFGADLRESHPSTGSLAHQPGRAGCLDAVWGEDFGGAVQVLYVHIGWLRERIEVDPRHAHYIQTLRGVLFRIFDVQGRWAFRFGNEVWLMSEQYLMLAIVQPEDVETATNALIQAGLRVTRISSIGGFLHQGNVTLLLGLHRDQVMPAGQLLAANCRTRIGYVNAAFQVTDVHSGHISGYAAPLEVVIGGATVFVLPTERIVRFGPQKEVPASEATARESEGMKLIIAIVPEKRSSEMLDTLIKAHYRATLVSTTGGFLRKGNATLLIGVESEKVNDVLQHIQGVCAATPARADSEEAYATIFVLDVEQYEQA